MKQPSAFMKLANQLLLLKSESSKIYRDRDRAGWIFTVSFSFKYSINALNLLILGLLIWLEINCTISINEVLK